MSRDATRLPGTFRPADPVQVVRDSTLGGRRVGKLTVVGLSPIGTGGGGARWVVQCACGAYEHRNTRFIRTGRAAGAACMLCAEPLPAPEGRTP